MDTLNETLSKRKNITGLIYKLETIIEYLKNNGGYNYEVYNRLCPGMGEPDSNIVEYAEDVLYMINLLINQKLRQALFEQLL